MLINQRFTISYVFYDGGNMETKIALIGTGGTIAGQGASDTDDGLYCRCIRPR